MGVLRIRSSGHEYTFEPGAPVRIGREPDSGVVVENPNVSRNHAAVTNEGGIWMFRDLDSSQGSWRDGERVETVEILGTVHLTLGREGRGEILVLEAAVYQQDDRSRPGGAVGGVDLAASTDIVGAGDSGTGRAGPGDGTVIVGRDGPLRPSAPLDAESSDDGTVVTGSELKLECAGRSYTFQPGETVRLGRDESCEVVVTNPTVSRLHATLHHDGTGWILSDQGSDSGLFREGGRIGQVIISGPTAVWLGRPETGERVVIVAADIRPGRGPRVSSTGLQPQPADQPFQQGAGAGTGTGTGTGTGCKVAAILGAALIALFMLLVVGLVAFVFLARS